MAISHHVFHIYAALSNLLGLKQSAYNRSIEPQCSAFPDNPLVKDLDNGYFPNNPSEEINKQILMAGLTGFALGSRDSLTRRGRKGKFAGQAARPGINLE